MFTKPVGCRNAIISLIYQTIYQIFVDNFWKLSRAFPVFIVSFEEYNILDLLQSSLLAVQRDKHRTKHKRYRFVKLIGDINFEYLSFQYFGIFLSITVTRAHAHARKHTFQKF